MSHQSFPKSNGPVGDGYVLTYVQSDGYWAPRSLSSNNISYTELDTLSSPGDVSAWTAVGTIGLVQNGSSILAMTGDNTKPHHFLQAIPAGVTASGPWKISIAGLPSFVRFNTYPEFGICVSNGVTAASSTGLFCGFYQFNSNVFSYGAWKEVLNTQTRPAIYFGDNGILPDYGPFYFRIIHDGTNIHYQHSFTKGSYYYTYFSNTAATVALSFTHYGLSIGAVNGAGYTTANVTGLSMVPISQPTITNVTFASSRYTVTTSGSHGLYTGDSVSILGVTGTGTSPNGTYLNTVVSTGANTFTVPGASFTYTSGGTVTLLSR